ncbi:hypothetical protein [Brachybacterium sp. UNK5269]|uniref:hypothetical protein n=1 Tax=Brachybacterium sp. UNK5269 TaxID=3408576 RepID=UPI003BAF4FF1
MVDESDGIEEAIEGQTRLLITAAAQAGDRIARMREDALRRAQATSEREARELQSRLAAEQRAVCADLSGVQRADWWENASPERIAQAYESAVAWRDEEPEAARAEQRIADELRTRHGISPDQLRAQVSAERGEPMPARYVLTESYEDAKTTRHVSRDDALALIDRTPRAGDLTPTRRQQFEDMRGWIGKDRDVDLAIAAKFPQIMTKEQMAAVRRSEAQHQQEAEQRDRAEMAALMAEATAEEGRAQDRREDRPDRPALAEEHEQRAEGAREEAGAKYDSAERRATTAADLETQGHDHETVARQMRADVSQGAPATEATKGGNSPRARRGRRQAGTNRQRERGGLTR